MRIGSLIIGLGSVLGGIGALRDGVRPSAPRRPDNPIDLGQGLVPAHRSGPPLKAAIHRVNSIGSRVKYIVGTIQKSRQDPNVRAFAVKAVSKKKVNGKFALAERDYEGELKAVFDDIRRNVRYVRDGHKLDTFQSARRTLEFGGGDCDDYTITMGSALQSIGYPVKLRIVQTKGSKDFNHIFLLAGLPPRAPTKWVPLDASVDKPAGWHPPHRMLAKIKDYDVP
jgi:predicted transglutaminase-like cysteine proteinase